MSLDATNWAWRADVHSSAERLVLLSLADRAGEEHKCYPSLQRLVKDTKLNRKTIIKVLDELSLKHFIKETGEIKGNGVKVYQLIGIFGREEDAPTSTKNGTGNKVGKSSNLSTSSKNGTSTKNGTGTSTKIGTETSTNFGTQNLPMNLPIESKNKKHWLCLKKLSLEISQANPDVNTNEIINATWFNREFRAFERFNADKNLCDDLMNYHFADWLLNAWAKYQVHKSAPNRKTSPTKQGASNKLSDKQIQLFAQRLSKHPEFAGKFAEGNESYEQLAARVAVKLADPAWFEKWKVYLKQVGYGAVA